MYSITAFIYKKRLNYKSCFGFLEKKIKSNYRSYVLVIELIKKEDYIYSFNSWQKEIIYLRNRELKKAKAHKIEEILNICIDKSLY